MTILMDQGFNVTVVYHNVTSGNIGAQFIHSKAVAIPEGEAAGEGTEGGMDTGMGEDGMLGATVKDPLLSNWFFVIGITVASLVIGGVIGILLAKKKIKKGIEIYED